MNFNHQVKASLTCDKGLVYVWIFALPEYYDKPIQSLLVTVFEDRGNSSDEQARTSHDQELDQWKAAILFWNRGNTDNASSQLQGKVSLLQRAAVRLFEEVIMS